MYQHDDSEHDEDAFTFMATPIIEEPNFLVQEISEFSGAQAQLQSAVIASASRLQHVDKKFFGNSELKIAFCLQELLTSKFC